MVTTCGTLQSTTSTRRMLVPLNDVWLTYEAQDDFASLVIVITEGA